MLDYFDLLTLSSWAPLALLARSQTSRPAAARLLWIASGVTLAAWVGSLYLDFVWARRVVAPIRVDLLLTIPVSTMTFAAIGAWGLRQAGGLAKIASVLLLALSLPTLSVFLHAMWTSGRDAARLDTRASLIFEAQFRNPRTFQRFFGPIESAIDPRAGHFRAESPRSYISRAVVNDRGHVWLMLRCGKDVECVQWEADLGPGPVPDTFSARSVVSAPRTVVVGGWARDRLILALPPSGPDVLVRAPVPYRERDEPAAAVTFHGSFAQTRTERDYLYLVQLWLWQDGDRWLAYYVRQNARCGTTNEFVSPSAYDGRRVGNDVSFERSTGERVESFHVSVPGGRGPIEGEVVYAGQPLERLRLEARAVLPSPLYDTAPLANFAATADWLKTISMGYFLPWHADCSQI